MTDLLSDNYAPDLRSSATVQLFADNQMGFRPTFSDNWNMRAAYDSLELSEYIGIRANAGDCIEWATPEGEDESYISFRNIIQNDKIPYIDTPGNHDLTTYNNSAVFPYKRTVGGIQERMTRSADEWASQVASRNKANVMMETDDIAVISISPDWWPYRVSIPNYGPPDPLTPAILSWLDQTLGNLGSKPAWIMSHAIPLGQFPTTTAPETEFIGPWSKISEILNSHSNVVGWLSGHWHISPTNENTVRKISVGSRSIVSINSPSSQGIRGGWTFQQQKYGDSTNGPEYMKSMFVSYDGKNITLRWRNHTAGRWVQPFGGKFYRIAV